MSSTGSRSRSPLRARPRDGDGDGGRGDDGGAGPDRPPIIGGHIPPPEPGFEPFPPAELVPWTLTALQHLAAGIREGQGVQARTESGSIDDILKGLLYIVIRTHWHLSSHPAHNDGGGDGGDGGDNGSASNASSGRAAAEPLMTTNANSAASSGT